jgi:hypothetical protein
MGVRWTQVAGFTSAAFFTWMSSCSGGVAPGTPCGSGVTCGQGTSCVGQAVWLFETDGASSKGCIENNQFCSLECHVDSDCASLGPKFRCVTGCTGVPGDCDDHPTFP